MYIAWRMTGILGGGRREALTSMCTCAAASIPLLFSLIKWINQRTPASFQLSLQWGSLVYLLVASMAEVLPSTREKVSTGYVDMGAGSQPDCWGFFLITWVFLITLLSLSPDLNASISLPLSLGPCLWKWWSTVLTLSCTKMTFLRNWRAFPILAACKGSCETHLSDENNSQKGAMRNKNPWRQKNPNHWSALHLREMGVNVVFQHVVFPLHCTKR